MGALFLLKQISGDTTWGYCCIGVFKFLGLWGIQAIYFGRNRICFFRGNRQKVAFSTMLEVWRRAEWVWRNLKKIDQIFFYYCVLGSRHRKDRIARLREHRRSDRRAFFRFIKGIFVFWHDTFFKHNVLSDVLSEIQNF